MTNERNATVNSTKDRPSTNRNTIGRVARGLVQVVDVVGGVAAHEHVDSPRRRTDRGRPRRAAERTTSIAASPAMSPDERRRDHGQVAGVVHLDRRTGRTKRSAAIAACSSSIAAVTDGVMASIDDDLDRRAEAAGELALHDEESPLRLRLVGQRAHAREPFVDAEVGQRRHAPGRRRPTTTLTTGSAHHGTGDPIPGAALRCRRAFCLRPRIRSASILSPSSASTAGSSVSEATTAVTTTSDRTQADAAVDRVRQQQHAQSGPPRPSGQRRARPCSRWRRCARSRRASSRPLARSSR